MTTDSIAEKKAKKSAYNKAYYERNLEKLKENIASYYVAHRTQLIEYQSNYRKENTEKCSKMKAEYYYKHQERIILEQVAYRANNPERVSEINAACYRKKSGFYNENPYEKKNMLERQREAQARYRSRHPDRISLLSRNRRALKRKALGRHTIHDVKQLLALQMEKCVICHVSIKKSYHVDHIVPLSRGGMNDKGNLQLLCPSCNLSKNAKDPIEFMQRQGFLL